MERKIVGYCIPARFVKRAKMGGMPSMRAFSRREPLIVREFFFPECAKVSPRIWDIFGNCATCHGWRTERRSIIGKTSLRASRLCG
jgi:hypothetical protein